MRDRTATGSATGSRPKTRTEPLSAPQQAEDVLDERRLARAVRADEAVDRPAGHGHAHRGQGRLGTEAARQLRHVDDRFTHPRRSSDWLVMRSIKHNSLVGLQPATSRGWGHSRRGRRQVSGASGGGLAPQVGFEPTTLRLTAGCSTAELLRNGPDAANRQYSRAESGQSPASDTKNARGSAGWARIAQLACGRNGVLPRGPTPRPSSAKLAAVTAEASLVSAPFFDDSFLAELEGLAAAAGAAHLAALEDDLHARLASSC